MSRDAGSGHPLYDPIYGDADGYAEDDEVSLSRIAKMTDEGKICCECSAEFTAAHGKPTACTHCWPKLPVEERAAVLRATHDEKNSAAWAARNRKRKQQRQRDDSV